MASRSAAALLLLLASCATTQNAGPSAEPWPPADTSTGIHDQALASIVERYWTALLAADPANATRLSVHRFDGAWEDKRPAALEARRAEASTLLAELEARIGRGGLDADDAISAEALVDALKPEAGPDPCHFERWNVSAISNPFVHWSPVVEMHPLQDPADARNLLRRYHQLAESVDVDIANLRAGLAEGLVSSEGSVKRVVTMLHRSLEEPTDRWVLMRPATATVAGFSAAENAAFRAEIRQVISAEAKPAFRRYLELLEREVLPKARPDSAPGLASLPAIGAGCYRAQIERHLGDPFDPKTIHREGLAEIAKIDAELTALGRRALHDEHLDLAGVIGRLREDPALRFGTAEEIEARARAALELAKSKLPLAFGKLPQADCVVRRVPDYEAPYSTVAYYYPPSPGEKPGEYFINVDAPTTRARFEAAVLAYHESIPGHHLQIAIAQELGALPAFRKHAEATAFTEGWALYIERVADELGLYADDLDRLGLLSFDAWRASRLVVDTGLHELGWSRQQAIDFMLAHTALARTNIENEVDRYIGWPGQALAYKIGQRAFLELRSEAESKLGPAFRLPAFHDAVLGRGAVPLRVLRRDVRHMIEAQ
ncbi:MAG: DUF885 domain-containing protein [Myxococcota bacterium]